MTTITIELGDTSNATATDVPEADKVKFKNITTVKITLTTPQGMNPKGNNDIDAGATITNNGFTISANPGASLAYSWKDTGSAARDVRTGTIRVT